MTRQYEVVYIFDSALEETAINERLARFHTLIQQPGRRSPPGEPLGQAHPRLSHQEARDRLLRRRQVRRRRPPRLPEFERAIKLDDGVLRFLVVVNEGAQPVPVTAGQER